MTFSLIKYLLLEVTSIHSTLCNGFRGPTCWTWQKSIPPPMHGQVKLFLLYERVSPFSKVGRHHSHMQTPGLLVSWMLDKDYTNCKLKFHSRTPPLFINSIFSLSPQRLADRHAALHRSSGAWGHHPVTCGRVYAGVLLWPIYLS